MNEQTVVSLIALAAVLLLAISALRGHQVPPRKTFWLALLWLLIFAVVALSVEQVLR